MPIPTRAVGIAIATAAAVGAPAPALGANAVFGGSTSAGDAIVIGADKKAKALRSAVVSWTAACDDGRRLPVAFPLKPVRAEPGFEPGFRQLATSHNGRGRFAGTQVGAFDMGDHAGAMTAKYGGRLTARRASGTLAATVTIVEKAGGTTVATCRTGTVRWSATRSPGRVFAGSTAQDHPVVVRLDAKRRTVDDLLIGWESATCKPDTLFVSASETFGGFPLSGGRFGDAFDRFYTPEGGGEGKVGYDVAGRVTRTRVSGTLRVNVSETDAAGALRGACDSGSVCWSAVTG
jgi:hypothetical protein